MFPSPVNHSPSRQPRLRLSGLRRVVLLLTFASWSLAPMSGCTSLARVHPQRLQGRAQLRKPPAPVANDWIDAKRQRREQSPDDLRVVDGLQRSRARPSLEQRLPAEPDAAGGRHRMLEWRGPPAPSPSATSSRRRNMPSAATSAKPPSAVNRPHNLARNSQRFYGEWIGFNLAWELDFWGRFRRAHRGGRRRARCLHRGLRRRAGHADRRRRGRPTSRSASSSSGSSCAATTSPSRPSSSSRPRPSSRAARPKIDVRPDAHQPEQTGP